MVEGIPATGDSSGVPTIAELIRKETDAGKTLAQLEAASGHRVAGQTFHALSRNPPKEFPKQHKTIVGMSLAFRVPETTVVLAYAASLGWDVRVASTFALRLPPGVDELAPEMSNALVSVVRAAVKQNGASNVQALSGPQEPDASVEAAQAQEALDRVQAASLSAAARARGEIKGRRKTQ